MPAKRSSKTKTQAVPEYDATKVFEELLQKAPEATHYLLRLFITGTTPRSMAAIGNIRALCERYLPGQFELEVVDIYQQPKEAQQEQIIAAPTLVREIPSPPRRMVGDFSDAQKVLVGLNLVPGGSGESTTDTKWLAL